MTTNIRTTLLAAVAAIGVATSAAAQSPQPAANGQAVKNIVLVHGAFADGSGWRGVYDRLTARGYRVSIVQNPLTSLADDVAATRRVLARQQGPSLLVGHSYGGTVITEAGTDANVAGLVYVAAFAPDTGESTGDQFKEFPPPPEFVLEPQADGFGFLNLEKFKIGFAADTSDADAAFLRDSQVPIALAAFDAKITQAAWRAKPSWYIVASKDNAIDPRLLRRTATRIGARTIEVEASHVPFLSRPDDVANAIDSAARELSRAAR